MNVPEEHLMVDKPFIQYQLPFQLMMMKVIILKLVVIIVADKRVIHINHSLLEPYVYFSIHKAPLNTYLFILLSHKKKNYPKIF
jgi:hypothetical protein